MATHSNGKVVDWEAVRRRLAATERMLANDFQPAPEQQARILLERAQALAREPQPEVQRCEMLEFSIAGESYVFEAEWVREIVVLRDLTPLPCTPRFVEGVVAIRGRIVSAVNLRRFLGLPERGIVDFHRIVVLHDHQMEFGVLADRVDGVAELEPAAFRRDAAGSLPGMLGEFAKGVSGEYGVLLDAAKLLRDSRMLVNLEVPS